MPACQGLAAALHLERVGFQGGGDQPGRKLHAGHAGRLEYPPLLFAQPLELMIDELAQALGQLARIRRRRRPGRLRGRFANHAPAHEIVHHRDHEQGVAVGVPVDEPPPLFEPRGLGVRRGEPDGEISGDLGGRQEAERQAPALRVRL